MNLILPCLFIFLLLPEAGPAHLRNTDFISKVKLHEMPAMERVPEEVLDLILIESPWEDTIGDSNQGERNAEGSGANNWDLGIDDEDHGEAGSTPHVVSSRTIPIPSSPIFQRVSWPTIFSTQCGVENIVEISGGNGTRPNQYPWMVRLPMGCGGSLITDRHVLTAKHCFKRDPMVNGESIRGSKAKVSVHNQHDPSDYQEVSIKDYVWPDIANHDIAIVILDTPVNLRDFTIGTVCLPASAKEDYRGQTGIALGWGQTYIGSPQSPVLKQVQLTVSQQQDKNWLYTEVPVINGEPQDPCAGDSGGPLLHKDMQTGRWTIIGTVYGGGYSCKDGRMRTGGKGVWNKVTDHLAWINSIIRSVLY